MNGWNPQASSFTEKFRQPNYRLTNNGNSTLAKNADAVLELHWRMKPARIILHQQRLPRWRCDRRRAGDCHDPPTQIYAEWFARYHPGGSLGRRLLTRVADSCSMMFLRYSWMRHLKPWFKYHQRMPGNGDGRRRRRWASGIITDGDLRRFMEKEDSLTSPRLRRWWHVNRWRYRKTPWSWSGRKNAKAPRLNVIGDQQANKVTGLVRIFD